MPKIVALLLALSLSLAVASAQNHDVEKLCERFIKQKNTQRTETANRLMQLLVSEGFGDEVVFTADIPSDTMTMTVCYYAAEYFLNTQQHDLCINYALQALPLTEGNADYTWRSETINLLMLAYFYKSNYIEALHYGEMGYDHDSRHHDYGRMSSTLNTIAGIYLGARQPEQARQYIEKAIEADQKTSDHEHAPAIYGVATEVYQGLEQYDKALDYARRAFALEQQRGNGTKAAIRLSQMAAAYTSMGDTAQARQLLSQSIPVLQQAAVMPSLGISLNTMGEVMRMEGRRDEAASYFNAANSLFSQTGDLYNRARSLHGLFAALYDTDPKAAMLHLDHYTKLKDTIYQNDMKQLLTNYSAKFRNDELMQENETVKMNNRFIVIASIIVVLLMLLALAFLLYAIRLKSRSNHQLLDLQHTRENFFVNITHEFRTPLTVILGLSQKLEAVGSPVDGNDIRTAGSIIKRQGSQLLLLINQLLDLSKAKAHVSEPGWRTDNVVAYINMIMETFGDFAADHGIHLFYAPRENMVQMDFVPEYLQKIMNNLITNAIKFTPKTNGHVNITTQLKGQHFIIQVADNGIGIEHEQLSHIFEPFYQADTDSQNIGTGVGLALTRQLVYSIDGQISVVSSPGKGTIFTVTLPIRHEGGQWQPLTDDEKEGIAMPLPAAEPAAEAMPADSVGDESGQRPRILIIEDNRDVAYYIGQHLSDYDTIYASNGRTGLEKAEQMVPDLIVTDLMMPEMDGLELCRRVRAGELTSHIPIIVITARSTDEDRIRGIEAGADAYLFKPFNADELLVRIDKLLEQRRLLREKYSRIVAGTETAAPDKPLLSDTDAKFIGRLNDLVYSLMGRGQATVETVASHMCMSPIQLRRKVQAITGKTATAYLLQIRLSNAQRLLDAQPDLSISDVAYRCGFSDQSHFSHAFKDAFGMTPSQWVKRAR